jgi:protein MAK11
MSTTLLSSHCTLLICWLSICQSGVLYTGGEDRCITAWDLSSGKVSSRIEGAHATRVKGVVVFGNSNDGSQLSNLISSASSDGVIRIWDIRTIGNGKPTPLAEANTKARLTCLAGTSLKCKSLKLHNILSTVHCPNKSIL